VAVRPWPRTGGDGVPADDLEGHVRNGLAMLQGHREAYGLAGLPDGLRELLEAVERRLRLALESFMLVEGARRGGLRLVDGCSCVVNPAGLVVLPCHRHDEDDTGTRHD
jgi:hypothetical protein